MQESIADVLSVLTNLHATLVQSKAQPLNRSVRDSSEYGKVFWMILDSVVQHVCLKQFWHHNSDAANVVHWRRLFTILRSLLPLASSPLMPEYVPELLRRRKIDTSVDYWGLVASAHEIVPTVVEQCILLEEREVCRTYLAQTVTEAIDEAESLDLENDYDESQRWHDEYGSITEDCEDYAALFPDDEEISCISDVIQIIEDYPRLSDREEENEDYSSLRSFSSSTDSDIQQMFADL